MLQQKLIQVLEEMDIKNVNMSDYLEDDLGMDSQEIVCLLEGIQNAFGVPMKDGDLTKDMTLINCLPVIARKLQVLSPKGANFEHSLVEEMIIDAPLGIVYSGLHQIAEWDKLLPHVTSIDVKYDDGVYQEFFMGVNGADGDPIKVRSIRRCQKENITFFQPEPPVFLKHHCGGWVFSALTPEKTLVTTYHHWALSEKAGDVYKADKDVGTAEKIERLLREHARFALTCWKNIQEEAV